MTALGKVREMRRVQYPGFMDGLMLIASLPIQAAHMGYGICQTPNNPVQPQHSTVLLGSSPLDGM